MDIVKKLKEAEFLKKAGRRARKKIAAALLRKVTNPDAKRVCEGILESDFFSHLIRGEILIPKEVIRGEIENQACINGLEILEFATSDEDIRVKISHPSLEGLQPEMGIRLSGLKINDKVQTFTIEYEIDDTLDDNLLTALIAPVARTLIAVFIKSELKKIKFIRDFSHTGRWITVDLNRIAEFKELQIIPGLNYRVFSLVTFSQVRHSPEGISIICDTSFLQFFSNLRNLLTKNKLAV